MNNKVVVLDVVGLMPELLGDNTPNINRLIAQGFMRPLTGVFPAVTTTAQSTMLTGLQPQQHGIVGNGWYERDHAEVMFWKQSNRLVQGKKVWQALKEKNPAFKCSVLFWWYNMYAKVDNSITPRPHYLADGRKIIDLYSAPTGLHQQIEDKLGKFPFFHFWGPKADIKSSQWIAKAAMMEFELNQPDLQLVYLPHLDYCLQKFGPQSEKAIVEVKAIDTLIGELIDFYQQHNVEIILVSEYGIEAVDTPVHINKVLRENNYIKVRETLHWENLDPGASSAFAVADHQIAHIYVRDNDDISAVKTLLENTPGIEKVLDKTQKQILNIDHQRAGDLIAIAEQGAWFTYYFWLDDNKAPDFARTIDIHRKPGYDPVEMFIDPEIKLPMVKIAWRLLQKKLGMRMLLDIIPLKPQLIKGSHGRLPSSPQKGPLIIAPKRFAREQISMHEVYQVIIDAFNDD